MSQWVQHISGQGEKWEVYHDDDVLWYCKLPMAPKAVGLPKSEYVLCDPPDVNGRRLSWWVDVTASCELVPTQDDIVHNGTVIVKDEGYRLRKIAMNELSCRLHSWAFIVERKAS